MTTIDQQIRSADDAIVRNIELLSAQRDFTARLLPRYGAPPKKTETSEKSEVSALTLAKL